MELEARIAYMKLLSPYLRKDIWPAKSAQGNIEEEEKNKKK